MKKYRKIKPTDKIPHLPKGIDIRYFFKNERAIFIYGEDTERRFTFEWDGISLYPNHVHWNYK